MKAGVYIITNLKNGKVYIGKSLVLERRLKYHREAIRNRTHVIQEFNTFNVEDFDIKVLHQYSDSTTDTYQEKCKVLSHVELFYINYFNSLDPTKGYNKNLGGGTGGLLSDYAKKKISEAKLGRKRPPRTPEHRKHLSEALKGRKKAR